MALPPYLQEAEPNKQAASSSQEKPKEFPKNPRILKFKYDNKSPLS
jgi:hypothetical protein